MNDRSSLLSTRLVRTLISASLIMAIVTALLGHYGIITAAYNSFSAVLSFVTLAIILPISAWFATKYRAALVAFFLLFNVLGIYIILLYVGSYNPFVMLWAFVIFLTYYYFGRWGFIFSSSLLIIETAACILLYANALPSQQHIIFTALSLCVCVGTIVIAYFGVRLLKSSNERSRKLVASQKAEELQLNRVNALLNSISDTVLTLNRYGHITSQNAAALSFFDTNQALVGQNIDTVAKLTDSGLQPISIKKLAENLRTTLIRDDISMKDNSDGIMRLSVQLSPIHDTYHEGSVEGGVVVIIRDITRQKALEDEKDEFISVTSHELRTPVAIAEGSLSNLLFMFEKQAKPELLAKSAQTAHDQVMYLARMINDLSTLSRAERGVGDVTEEINVNDLLHELYLRYQPEAEAKSLKLDLDIDKLPSVITSRLYLEEMLQNFLTNAIKYTKEGTVTLSGKLKDGEIEFSVKDTGIGISKVDQAKVFDKFFRSEDYRTRETGGTGLGLYVVRKLADKMSTTIQVKSRLNHGSQFGFTLPLAKPSKPVKDEA